MSRLRVASVCGNLHFGGDENRLLHFARTVDTDRIDHCVITLFQGSEAHDARLGPMAQHYRDSGVKLITLEEPPRRDRRERWGRLAALGDLVSVGKTVARLARVLREERIDVVDARLRAGILFGGLAGRLARVPAIVATDYHTGTWSGGWHPAGQVALHLADALVTDSDAKIEEYQHWLWRRHRRAVMIPNGIATPRSEVPRDEMRSRLGIPQDARVVGQVSRVLPYKGQGVLLEAFAEVAAAVPEAFLVCCGYSFPDEAYREQLLARADELGLGERVRVFPYPGPIADVWNVIDVQAHASLRDSSPISVYEGMSLGLPAVVTEVGGMRELVADGVSALVVPMDDAKSLAQALLRVLEDPALARRLGQEARARYEQRYRPEVMTRAIEALMLELVDRKRAR